MSDTQEKQAKQERSLTFHLPITVIKRLKMAGIADDIPMSVIAAQAFQRWWELNRPKEEPLYPEYVVQVPPATPEPSDAG